MKIAGFRSMKDPELLELAAQQGRILATHDRQTMTRYFRERLDSRKSTPGLPLTEYPTFQFGKNCHEFLPVEQVTPLPERIFQ